MNTLIQIATPMETFVDNAGSPAKRVLALEIRNLVINPHWYATLRKCVEVLKPICVGIVMFQNDSCPVSTVQHFFSNLHRPYDALVANQIIAVDEKNTILALIDTRWSFVKSQCHEIGYLLDPRYLGENIAVQRRVQLDQIIINNNPQMTLQLGAYRAYINTLLLANDPLLNQLRANNVPEVSVQFFINQLPPNMFPLVSSYLQNIFSLVCSSSASERNFSTHSFIHSKARNRLGYDKVKMLVYIFVNTPWLDGISCIRNSSPVGIENMRNHMYCIDTLQLLKLLDQRQELSVLGGVPWRLETTFSKKECRDCTLHLFHSLQQYFLVPAQT